MRRSVRFPIRDALRRPCLSAAALASAVLLVSGAASVSGDEPSRPLRLHWEKNYLTVSGEHLPGKSVRILYLEAYCRPGSTDRDWKETTIGHSTRLVEADPDGRRIRLHCTLKDGVEVAHEIRTEQDAVDFRLTASNPTQTASLAHWAQPCVRVDAFTGRTQQTYLEKSFVFLDGKEARMPTPRWATEARYVPGQVWAPKHVDRNDVNPRPLSPDVPSSGLIGCRSGDGKWILATAWEPYQELFQGVIVCLHSDFRIGGLAPGETKRIRGKLYLVPGDLDSLVERYGRDFPEHVAGGAKKTSP